MNLTIEQLAEIIAGITKSQQAIIDGIDSANAGWKNTHLLPKITTAANMRLATPRLMDVPARVLMRSQARTPMDVATITRLLHEAVSGEPVPAGATPMSPAAVAAVRNAPAVAPAAVAAGAIAGAAGVASAAATESTPAAGGDELSSVFDT